MAEAIVASLISLLFAVLLVEMLLPFFISIIQECFPTVGILPSRNISFGILNPSFSVYMTVVSVAVGIISGLYPAIFLSRLDPAFVIKGELRSGKKSAILRKTLVVFQFCIAITFISPKEQHKFAAIERLLGKPVHKGEVPVQFGAAPEYRALKPGR